MSKPAANPASPADIPAAAPPYVDCIQWVPRRFAGGGSPTTLADLVFEQRIFQEIQSHLESAGGEPVFGIICGAVFEDPTCARRWTRLQRAVGYGGTVPEGADESELATVLERMSKAVREGESVLGWYRTHHDAGLYLSPEEARFHESRFNEPWHFALILAGTPDRRAGGIFQRTDPEGLSRSVYTPFYELAPQKGRDLEPRSTFVGWTNYQTDARVTLADPSSERSIAVVGVPDELARLELESEAAEPRDGARTDDAEDFEAEWEKRQIQRSLSAVGRSLGPGVLSELGPAAQPGAPSAETPAEAREAAASDEADRDAAGADAGEPAGGDAGEPEAASAGAPHAPVRAATTTHVATAAVVRPTVTPPRSRRSRRRRVRLDPRVLSAAAGLLLVGLAGWVGSRTLGGGSGGDDAGGGDASAATISLASGLGDASAEGVERDDGGAGTDTRGSADPLGPTGADVARDGTDRQPTVDGILPGAGQPGVGTDSQGGEGPGDDLTDGSTDDPATNPGGAAPDLAEGAASGRSGGEPTATRAASGTIVDAPDLTGLDLGDPAVSGYENALAIFRKEFERYETHMREFDEGLQTCNPLNLAFRGVRDAFARVERRYEAAREQVAGPATRAFEGARRQKAVVDTHYGLTECPMPVDG